MITLPKSTAPNIEYAMTLNGIDCNKNTSADSVAKLISLTNSLISLIDNFNNIYRRIITPDQMKITLAKVLNHEITLTIYDVSP